MEEFQEQKGVGSSVWEATSLLNLLWVSLSLNIKLGMHRQAVFQTTGNGHLFGEALTEQCNRGLLRFFVTEKLGSSWFRSSLCWMFACLRRVSRAGADGATPSGKVRRCVHRKSPSLRLRFVEQSFRCYENLSSALFHLLGIEKVAVTSSMPWDDNSFVTTGVPAVPSYVPSQLGSV